MSLMHGKRFREFRNRALSGATAWAVRLLYLTVRFRVQGWERAKLQAWHGRGTIFAFWHNVLMVPLGHESRRGCAALMSPGPDGEFAARVVARFGVQAVRGSSSQRGTGALLGVIKSARSGSTFAVTPDGPRGPRYHFQLGVAYLASRTGLPVTPVGIALSRAWKLNSWDRYRIPRPFCRAHLVFGEPLHLSAGLDRRELETARGVMEGALHQVSREAARQAGCAWPD